MDTWQEEDLKCLSDKLNKDLELLKNFQEQQNSNLNVVLERERVQLNDKINLRLAILEQKVFFRNNCFKIALKN